jgi:hypothetical protein
MYNEDSLISPLPFLVIKRLLALTCILISIVSGKAESIDQRNFARPHNSFHPNEYLYAHPESVVNNHYQLLLTTIINPL